MAHALSGEFIQVSLAAPHVLLVQLSRKPVNAFHDPFWREYSSIFDRIGQDGDVRAVVLCSSLPKLFTAGLDLNAAASTLAPSSEDPGRTALAFREHILDFQHAISAPERCPVPVIVAMHGIALGLAIDIALACDVRYAASDASFSIKEVDVGLAADIGTLARAPKATASASLLRELAYTARAFSAAEALTLGFVSKVIPGGRDEIIAAALEVAKVIAQKSPVAVAGTKHLLLHARDHTVDENLAYTATWNGAMLQSSDLMTAVQAARTKRGAQFEPLRKAKL